MKRLLISILSFLPFVIWAHQDTYHKFEYGNVTVRFKTGHFFEEINNAKVIGQYAKILSDSLNYGKPILIDFIHDYGYSYEGQTFSYINYGSGNYEIVSFYKRDSIEDNVFHMVPYSDSVENAKGIEKEIYKIHAEGNNRKITIRQFGYHFDVTKTLNLLYYALTNKSAVMKLSRKETLPSYLKNTYYRFESIPSDIINNINLTNVESVQELLKTKIYRDVDTVDRHRLYYSYYSQNGKIHLFAGLHDKEIVLDTLEQVYSFIPRDISPEVLFVFNAPNQFKYYELNTWVYTDYKVERSKQHFLPFDPYEYSVGYIIEWFGDDVFFININCNYSFLYDPFAKFPYLANDDVLIKDFEEYIKSYRKKKEK